MRAYLYISPKQRGKKWPKAHWFFDDNPSARRIMSACGFEVNRTKLDGSPTASYYVKERAIREGWCEKCRKWMMKNSEALLAHQRLMGCT